MTRSDPLSRPLWTPFHAFVALVGIATVLNGLVPMVLALCVSNALIDEGGIEPGEREIMASWDKWAFSLRFALLALAGMAILCIHFALVPSRDKPQYAISIACVIAGSVVVASYVFGWFIFDPR